MPTWDGFLVPVLQVLAGGAPTRVRNLVELAADEAGLTDGQRAEALGSGQLRYRNRIAWAVSFLLRAQALDRPQRATYLVNERGLQLLRDHPDHLEEKHLKDFPEFANYRPAERSPTAASEAKLEVINETDLDPLEQIDTGVQRVHQEVSRQLLERLRASNPEFLEQSVLDVLVAMGYGGVEQRARRIGGSGDGGVDGVIDQDPLGLARIYVQAKRYASDNVVGRPQIQGFVGALHGQQASQGIFITTSSFTREAVDYAHHVAASVVLIDGDRLADLMIRHTVGVQIRERYAVVEIDEDYFE